MILAVNREFKQYSLTALTGSNATALKTLTFLQTNIDCVRHSIQLCHNLDIQVLEWICCPLRWFYVPFDNLGQHMAAAAARARLPVLRTLQENPINSKTFEEMCFPCAVYGRRFKAFKWTLLQAICLYIRKPRTAHYCSDFRDLRPTIPEWAGQSLHHEDSDMLVHQMALDSPQLCPEREAET